MADRLSLRARMALGWGVGFFILGAIFIVVLAFFFERSVADDPAETIGRIVADLGLDVDQVGGLTVSDAAGNVVSATQIRPILQDVVSGTRADVSRALWLLLATLVVVAALAGWWLAGRTMRPIVSMTAQVREVSSQRLDARIGHHGPDDELHELADAFDGMMDRLERAFTAQRHFAAAASHELRTPLTLIRTELDVGLDTRDPSREELDAMAESIRYAVGRSEQVIDGLLLLARSGIVEPTATSDLAELVIDALEEELGIIEEHDLTVRNDVPGGAAVRCDPALMERMLRNLIDNAALHNEPGGWIEIEAYARDDEVIARITNTGPMLDEATVARLGEPFYRARASKGDVPGTGLGLAIAKSIAEAHGGRVDIDGRPGGGVIATVVLPAIEPDRSMAK